VLTSLVTLTMLSLAAPSQPADLTDGVYIGPAHGGSGRWHQVEVDKAWLYALDNDNTRYMLHVRHRPRRAYLVHAGVAQGPQLVSRDEVGFQVDAVDVGAVARLFELEPQPRRPIGQVVTSFALEGTDVTITFTNGGTAPIGLSVGDPISTIALPGGRQRSGLDPDGRDERFSFELESGTAELLTSYRPGGSGRGIELAPGASHTLSTPLSRWVSHATDAELRVSYDYQVYLPWTGTWTPAVAHEWWDVTATGLITATSPTM
jgi:hypothetical protein